MKNNQITKCQLCESSKLSLIIDLGHHPLADSFLNLVQIKSSINTYPLQVFLCNSCGHAMLGYFVPPEERYQKIEYSYTASNSKVSLAHFKEMVESIITEYKVGKNDLVVDIGSNDGTLLNFFKELSGSKVIGVEPSKNIYKIAKQRGINTINDFFTKVSAVKIAKKDKAKVITATNVFNHIADMKGFIKAIKVLLHKDGVFVFEVPYFLGLMENGEFDTIYLEHISYFNVKPFDSFFRKNGLQIVKLERNDYMCSTIRVYVRWGSTSNVIVKDFIKKENNFGMYKKESYSLLAKRILKFKFNLNKQLYEAKERNDGKIIAIGAATKGNTLLNYCKIDNTIIDFVTDASPLKIGKFMPGSSIPILSDNDIGPDVKYALILPWNIADFLVKKLAHLKLKFIIPKMK